MLKIQQIIKIKKYKTKHQMIKRTMLKMFKRNLKIKMNKKKIIMTK